MPSDRLGGASHGVEQQQQRVVEQATAGRARQTSRRRIANRKLRRDVALRRNYGITPYYVTLRYVTF